MLSLPKSRPALACAVMIAAAGLTTPALAHHSYSMFDRTKSVTIEGTVRTWELVNPHSYLWVVVQKDKDMQIWGLEGGGISALLRAGLNKSSIKPGDKVTVVLHPLRDGRTGGQLVKVVLADGTVVGEGGGPRPAPGGAGKAADGPPALD
jgi:hypothetical protein